MTDLPQGIAGLVEELIRLLDEQIELLDVRCSQLAALSDATTRRDDEALEALLADIESAQQHQTGADTKLQALRNALANAAGWPVEQMRLALLIEHLPDQQSTAVDYRRQQIILLTDRLKRQHMETALILSECARVNRLLLEALFPETRSVTTYGAKGENSWGQDRGLVDVES